MSEMADDVRTDLSDDEFETTELRRALDIFDDLSNFDGFMIDINIVFVRVRRARARAGRDPDSDFSVIEAACCPRVDIEELVAQQLAADDAQSASGSDAKQAAEAKATGLIASW